MSSCKCKHALALRLFSVQLCCPTSRPLFDLHISFYYIESFTISTASNFHMHIYPALPNH